VLPLDDRGVIRSLEQPAFNRPRKRRYLLRRHAFGAQSHMLELPGRSYSITADVDMPAGAQKVCS